MKSLLLATIIICAVTGSVPGQSAKHNDALEQTIRRLELEESDAVVRSRRLVRDCRQAVGGTNFQEGR